MGYFSEQDFMQREEAEWGNPTELQQLTDRMDDLSNRLIDLEDECPYDMSGPEYDRMFYSECLTGTSDDTDTIQGVLQAIRKTEEHLHIAEEKELREFEEQQQRTEWRNTVWETGATPDYQIVLLGVFFPAADRSVAA